MKINENCIKAVKKFIKETFEIEIEDYYAERLINHILNKKYLLAEGLLTIVFAYSTKGNNLTEAINKFYHLRHIAEKQNVLKKLSLIISYYQEDYDKLADEITNLLS